MSMSQLDPGQIIKHVYDSVEEAIKISGSIEVTESATAADGAALPDVVKVVAGYDGSAVQVIKTDSSGELQIDVLSSALPTGAATSANQTTANSSLSSIDGKIPSNLTVTSTRLLVDGSGVTQPISAASLPLPTGASTLAEQQTQTTSLQLLDDTVATTASAIPSKGFAISGTDGTNARVIKTDTSGELQVDVLTMPTTTVTSTDLDIRDLSHSQDSLKIGDGTEFVSITASNQMEVAVTASLPAGTNAIGKLSSNDGVDIGDVTINNASGASAVNIQDGGNSITVDGSVTVSATDLDIRDLSSVSDSVSAVQSGTWTVSDAGFTSSQFIRNDYSSINVTTAAYVELIASTSATYKEIEIFDSSGQTLKIAFGAAASEVDKFLIFPGGNGRIKFTTPSGTRVSIRAVSATANSGEIDINFYG